MRVSIVIPAHNEERYVRACLESISRQTVAPYEVIIVDNNCSDDTASIAAAFPFVRVIKESKQGIVHARNAGFDAARGAIIGRIDADVTLPADWVAHIQTFYGEGHERQAWTGGGFFYNVRLQRLMSWAYSLLAFRLNRLLTGTSTLWGSNMAITRTQWAAVREDVHRQTDVHEDLDLALHLTEAGYTIHYDATIRTNAELRPVASGGRKLWGYVLWWPNTLRVHRRWQWVVVWWVGVTVLYPGVYVLAYLDKLARLMKRRSSV